MNRLIGGSNCLLISIILIVTLLISISFFFQFQTRRKFIQNRSLSKWHFDPQFSRLFRRCRSDVGAWRETGIGT